MKKKKQKLFINWASYAYMKGKLARTQNAKTGELKLIFLAEDGTRFPVFNIGREEKGICVKRLFLNHLPTLFQPHIWKMYPQTFRGVQGLIAIGIEEEKPKYAELETLYFEASVKSRQDDKLMLFVGRRSKSEEFNFLELCIPPKLGFPDVKMKDKVEGKAIRAGHEWILTDYVHTSYKTRDERAEEKEMAVAGGKTEKSTKPVLKRK